MEIRWELNRSKQTVGDGHSCRSKPEELFPNLVWC